MFIHHHRPRLRYVEQPGTEPTPGAPPPPPDDDFKSPESKARVLADLAKERDARQALEQTVTQMQQAQQAQMAAIGAAFGVKPDKADTDGSQLLATLQQQVAQMQREALVLRVAAAHGLTATEDIDFLQSAKDEDAMGKLAGRLAAKAPADAPGTPKPDLTQGGKPDAGISTNVSPGMGRLQAAYANSSTTP